MKSFFFHDFQPALTLPSGSIISVTTFSSKKMLELTLVPVGIEVQVPARGRSLRSRVPGTKPVPGWHWDQHWGPARAQQPPRMWQPPGGLPPPRLAQAFRPRLFIISEFIIIPLPGKFPRSAWRCRTSGQKRKGWVSMATAFPEEGCGHLGAHPARRQPLPNPSGAVAGRGQGHHFVPYSCRGRRPGQAGQ